MRKHGTVYSPDEYNDIIIPVHFYCRCQIVPMRTKTVGTATDNGMDGADAYLFYIGQLPDYYIYIEDARNLGWIPREGNLSTVAPDKMIFGGEFSNREGKLPSSPGRIWYEADINYVSGHRGSERILFSSDGLIFVTYDHYKTFYEITG